MNQTTLTQHEVNYQLAKEYATDEVKFDKDTSYGCGVSFITIKWGSFVREMKKLDLVRKDGYWGWILETNEPVSGTLEQEKYNLAFAKRLNELDGSIHAFCHTRLN